MPEVRVPFTPLNFDLYYTSYYVQEAKMFSVRDLRDNFHSVYLESVKCLGGKAGIGDGYRWTDCSPGFWSTHVYDLQPDLLNSPDKCIQLYENVKSGLIPQHLTHFSDGADGAYPALLYSGFVHKTTMPGMQCRLSGFDFSGILPEGFEITRLSGQTDAEAFTDMIQRGLVTSRLCYAPHFEKLAGNKNFYLLLGRYKGEPAATGLGYISGGVTGLSVIVVDDKFRGLGLGKAMTLQLMLEGKKAGCTDAVLYASKAGEPVYKKMGYGYAGYVHIYKAA